MDTVEYIEYSQFPTGFSTEFSSSNDIFGSSVGIMGTTGRPDDVGTTTVENQ